MAELSEGAVLGERFHVLGVLGRGGQATVYLAMDGLRQQRVALKVVHAHLTSDPSVRRRLQREVHAASLVQHEAALVPYDLHEVDGHLALSLPFHPGQTLAERVSSEGALSAGQVRALGVRLASALADAHRSGVLHRDVTANNILLGADASDAVLTDFGLARLTQQQATRATAALGTAGYAAPEVYSGERSDPRSDLYGLGCALYLAAAGSAPFDTHNPMGALQQQLEEGWTPLSEVRPDLPSDLVQTIEALLRREPAARPQGAREVVDALESHAAAEGGPARGGQADRGEGSGPEAIRRQFLPPGRFTVVVFERDDDETRRQMLRVQKDEARHRVEAELLKWGKAIADTVRGALGIPAGEDAPSPEHQLVAAVARETGVAADALQLRSAVLEKKFRLVDATDRDTADRLADAAREAGFKATVASVDRESGWLDLLARYFWVPIAVGWPLFPFVGQVIAPELLLPILIAMSIVLPIFGSARQKRKPDLEGLRVAYRASLHDALDGEVSAVPRFAVGVESTPASEPEVEEVPEEVVGRGTLLRRRADAALDALEASIADAEDLPEPAAIDLRGTARELRRAAEALGEDVDRLEAVLGEAGAPEEEMSRLQSRLDRLLTLQRAGESVDGAELSRLQRALDEHRADQEAAEQVEAQLTAGSAQLLEIASTASRVRRQLVAAPEPAKSADDLVQRLRHETRAADDARREAGRRAQAARQRRGQ